VANDDGRAAKSGAWAAAAAVLIADVAFWEAAFGSGVKFPVFFYWLAATIVAIVLVYMCFAGAWGLWPVRRSLPLEKTLESALDSRKSMCLAAGRPLYTFDLLLVLLEMPGGRVAGCFDDAQAGWAAKVRAELEGHANSIQAGYDGGFVPFEWPERKEFGAAQQAARLARKPKIADVHLLLGILATPSTTMENLRNEFGDQVQRLREGTTILAKKSPRGRTPAF